MIAIDGRRSLDTLARSISPPTRSTRQHSAVTKKAETDGENPRPRRRHPTGTARPPNQLGEHFAPDAIRESHRAGVPSKLRT